MRTSTALIIAIVRNYSGVARESLNCSQETPLQEWIWRGSQMCRREEETHLRHISPVSVILGCQILVKHFTLGGCNIEKGHKSPNLYLQCKHMCACAPPPTFLSLKLQPRAQIAMLSHRCTPNHYWTNHLFSQMCLQTSATVPRPGLVYFILYLFACACVHEYICTLHANVV